MPRKAAQVVKAAPQALGEWWQPPAGGGPTEVLVHVWGASRKGAAVQQPRVMRVPTKGALGERVIRVDDTVGVTRRKLSTWLSCPPQDVCMWVRRPVPSEHGSPCKEAAIHTFVSRALHGRRTISKAELQDLLWVYTRGSAPAQAPAATDGPALNVEQAMTWATAQWGEAGVSEVWEPVGAVLARQGAGGSWTAGLFGADPIALWASRQPPVADPLLVTADGQPREGSFYTVLTAPEWATIENTLRRGDGSAGLLPLHVAVLADVAAVLPALLKDARLTHGVLPRLFPLRLQGGDGSGARSEQQQQADRDAERELHELRDAADPAASAQVDVQCGLQHVSLRIRPPFEPLRPQHTQPGATVDLLYDTFSEFRTSSSVPFIKFWNGTSSTIKLHRPSVTTIDKGVPAAKLQAWARSPMGGASITQGSLPYLKFQVAAWTEDPEQGRGAPVTEATGAYASVFVRHDLSLLVQRSLPTHMFAGPDAMAHVIDKVNQEVVRPVQALLDGSDAGSRLRTADMQPWTCGSNVQVARISAYATLTCASRTPTPRQLAAVLGRMRACFTPIMRFDGSGPSLTLLYRRSDGAGRPERLNFVLELTRSLSREDAVQRIVEAFDMDPDKAASEVDAARGTDGLMMARNVPQVRMRADTAPHVVLTPLAGGLGYEVELNNVQAVEQVGRILALLRLAVAPGADGLLAWRDGPTSNGKAARAPSASHESQRTAEPLPDLATADGQVDADLVDLIDDEVRAAAVVDTAPSSSPPARGTADAPQGGEDEALPHAYILSLLKRADPALFKFHRSNYGTVCGHVDGRQPVVVSPAELARIDKQFPGSHTGALPYGSSPEMARRNLYICPRVWCPKSRTSMSDAQFKAAGRKCPFPDVDEQPLLFNAPYFGDRPRYPGFLTPNNHPLHLCMPCCFLRPKTRVTKCGARLQEGTAEGAAEAPAVLDAQARPAAKANTDKRGSEGEGDAKYVRGDVVPLDVGRFGTLPPGMQVGGVLAPPPGRTCGNRADGSGQVSASTQCYVRLGVPLGKHAYLQAAVSVLRNPNIQSVQDLCSAVREQLTPEVFLALSGGQLCRVWMNAAQALGRGGATPKELRDWLERHQQYATSFRLQDVLATLLSPQHPRATTSWEQLGAALRVKSTDPLMLRARREAVVCEAMSMFLGAVGDDDVIKTHISLGDLLSRPLPWLNPHRVNILVLEKQGGGVYAACTPNVPASRFWRLADPVAMLMRQGPVYEPVIQIISRKRGLQQRAHFSYDSNPQVHSLVNRFIQGCATGAEPSPAALLLWAMRREKGTEPRAQVLDGAMHLVGFVSARDLYVPLVVGGLPEAPLAGEDGGSLACLHLGDLASVLKPSSTPQQCADVLERLSRVTGWPGLRVREKVFVAQRCVALVLHGGSAVVPLDMARLPSDAPASSSFLRELMVLAPPAMADPRVRYHEAAQQHDDALWAARSVCVKKLRTSPEHMQQLVALRSKHHPFPPLQRRNAVEQLVTSLLSSTPVTPKVKGAVVDALLFAPNPFVLQRAAQRPGEGKDATQVVLTEVDVLSGALERLSAVRASPYTHPQHPVHGHRDVSTAPLAPAVQHHASQPGTGALGLFEDQIARKDVKRKQILSREAVSGGPRWRQYLIRDVDALRAVALAACLVHSDSVTPAVLNRDTLVTVVQDALLQRARDRDGGRHLAAALKDHPSLKLANAGALTLQAAAALSRRVAEPQYVPGAFDAEVAAMFCGINLVLLPASFALPASIQTALALDRPSGGRRSRAIEPHRAADSQVVRVDGARDPDAQTLVLRKRDTLPHGFDVVLDIARGGRLLFSSHALSALIAFGLGSGRRA